MSANQAVFPIATMARVLGVSEAGYHAWRHRPASAHAAADAALLKRVRTVHASSRETHGAPRVQAALQADGHQHGHQRIARLMRAAGLTGASRRRNRVTTTRRDKDARPAPGLVDRDFVALKPNELRVADITFVQTASGFLYLAVVLDAWSRKIVGWSIANHLRAELVLDALEMAIGQRRPGDEIHHSDQGSQLGLKWLSQHPDKGVAMTKRRRRSDRSGRAPLFSPGRPAVAGRDEQRRFWAAIAAGTASEDAALQVGMSQAVGTRLFRKAGGMPPTMFRPSAKPLSGRYLSFAEREEIALLRVQGCSTREVARRLGRAASTISREPRRNAATRNGDLAYRATTAQWHAERSARRPKQGKLGSCPTPCCRSGCPVWGVDCAVRPPISAARRKEHRSTARLFPVSCSVPVAPPTHRSAPAAMLRSVG